MCVSEAMGAGSGCGSTPMQVPVPVWVPVQASTQALVQASVRNLTRGRSPSSPPPPGEALEIPHPTWYQSVTLTQVQNDKARQFKYKMYSAPTRRILVTSIFPLFLRGAGSSCGGGGRR